MQYHMFSDDRLTVFLVYLSLFVVSTFDQRQCESQTVKLQDDFLNKLKISKKVLKLEIQLHYVLELVISKAKAVPKVM